ncbi:MAG: hypothetical protein IJ489_02755 [Clostridia bacterium]|nr:hypothetical protein [Clostridia bacterium]
MTKFFAAANTEAGFYSLFNEVFSPDVQKRIYILKGGPGSGKSTLMKRVGAEAEKRGLDTEYIYCSSDTDSLDGILIPALRTAILDGTAPHVCDPIYPGAAERIVNLGEAFDEKALTEKRELISAQIREKNEKYQSAYRFLAAAGKMEKEREALLSPLFLTEKADAAVRRLLSSFYFMKEGGETHRYISAIGTNGEKTLDTLWLKAKKVYAVTGKHGLAYLFMSRLYRALSAKGIAMTVCRTPLSRLRTEAIFIEGENILFTVCDEKQAEKAEKTVNCLRFIRRETLAARRNRLRFAEKCRDLLVQGALDALHDAGTLHAKTEAIYGKHIDFSKIDAIGTHILCEIFENNM